jgi:preprotein translocase subunit SecY
MTNAEELNLIHKANKPKGKALEREKLALLTLFLLIVYECLSIVSYIEVNDYLMNGDG